MTQKQERTFAFRQIFMLLLCVCLTLGILFQPVRSTVSYITSLSATCVNTFTAEEGSEPPVPPTDPDTPDTPAMGEESYFEWGLLAWLLSIAGLAVTCLLWRREITDKKHR